MSEEKYFKQVVRGEDACFVNFGGKFLEVKVNSLGYDYAEVEVIDSDDAPEAVALKGKMWVVPFTALRVQRKE